MQDSISAIIIDDEQDARDGLETLLNSYHTEIEIVAKAGNAVQGLQEIIRHKPGLIFLDIEMPGKDGFFVAKELESLDLNSSIIFVTAYDQYAIQAIKHAAFDFITKPVDPDELAVAITRFKTRKDKESIQDKLESLHAYLNPTQLRFHTTKGFILIDPKDIIYCSAEGNYTELFLVNDRKVMVTQQIGQLENQLDHKQFVRISRSYLLNTRYMKEFNRKKKIVELNDNNLPDLPVSKNGIKRLMQI